MASRGSVNKILELYLASQYAEGLVAFHKKRKPNPSDRMWAGQCLYLLDRPIEAVEFLLRASAEGLEDASALAASVFYLAGEVIRAAEILEGINQDQLSAFGAASFERTLGTLASAEGRHRVASEHFLRAWTFASRDSSGLGQRFLASFTTTVALAYAEIGRDREALLYLNRALEQADDQQRAQLLLVRVLCHTYTGATTQAHTDFQALENLTNIHFPVAQIAYFKGVLAWVEGLNSLAVELFLEAISASSEMPSQEIEVYSLLQVAAIALGDDGLAVARAYLARAKNLAEGSQQHGYLGLRHGALLVRLHDAQAVQVLESALAVFQSLELDRELGIVHLHLAEAHLRLKQSTLALEHLNAATDARHALGCGVMLAVELRGLPWCFEYLAGLKPGGYLDVLLEDWRELDQSGPGQVSVQTLGGYGLKFNGQDVRVQSGLVRTVEVLAYLCEHTSATMQAISDEVFSQQTANQARKHIHVIRDQLTKTIPGLVIPYLPETKKYVLKHLNLRLRWDVHEVRTALKAGGLSGLSRALALYTGTFLPQSDGNWAHETRADLEFSLARIGLETLEELFKLGELQACTDLAFRLLEINPVSIEVAILLIRAVASLKGVLAAQDAFERVSFGFERGIGEVPEALLEVKLELQRVMN